MRKDFFTLVLAAAATILTLTAPAWAGDVQLPSFRMKLGISLLKIDAGEVLVAAPLGSLVTIQPSILWDLPSIRMRAGIHYLADVSGNYGLLSLTGIGASAYFYPWGLSSSYEIGLDNVVYQKSRPGPYLYAGITPVNMSISRPTIGNQAPISFSALIFETMLAAGYDYPLSRNTVLFAEGGYRFGAATSNEQVNGAVRYSGLSIMLGFTIYYF